ncbi:MAG: hypothetical protein C7B45_15570 [Sulfobacillus acidophilus]|uniref:SF3 helicase domain-containing protein n=1 Tax=Sulfobacillus acidophilus TaxID=53633 RepID=A0A2T2WDH4_9FIRM|nr:MAG: hypothetical protein C7B45_15570 [Sulfobacillus acidophilus]
MERKQILTDSISEREQSGKTRREITGKDPILFPGNGAGRTSLGAPVVPGVVGDELVTQIVERVLQRAGDYAAPGKNVWKIDTYQLAVAIIAETAAQWRHDQPWIFVRRRYVEGGTWVGPIALKVGATFGQKDPLRLANTVSATVGMILGVSPRGAQFAKAHWDAKPKLALKNGTLDLTDPANPVFQTGQWSAADRITWLVEADWDPQAHSQDVDQFLASSIPNAGQREMMLEYLGLVLARWDLSLQSYLFQLGGGSNGKGLIQDVLRTLCGEAVSSISLGHLASNQFAAAHLVDSAVNVVGDESASILKDSSKLKQLTGGDAMSMEVKFRMAYAAVPKTKLIFSLNQLPRIVDFTNGFFRRPLIVEFPMVFAKNPKLEEALKSQTAMGYWLRLFVEAYGRLKARGDFERQYTRGSLQAWREQDDIVSATVAEGFLQIDPQGTVAQDALVAGMKIFGELLGMESPRLAEVLNRLNALAAWVSQGTNQQPTVIKPFKPHGQPREVQGVNWGPEIFTTQYRPTPRDDYQPIAKWIGVEELDMPF